MTKREFKEAVKCYINDVLQSAEVIKYYCHDVATTREIFRDIMSDFKEESEMEQEFNEVVKEYVEAQMPKDIVEGVKRYISGLKRKSENQDKREKMIEYYINEIARMNGGIRCYCECLGEEIDTFRSIADRYHCKVANSDEDYIDLLRKMVDGIIYRCGQLAEEISTFHIRVLNNGEEK